MVSSADPLSISPLPYIPIQRRLVQNRSLFLVLFLAVVGFNRLFTCSTSSSSSSINAPLESKGIHETETGTESEEQYQGKDSFLKNTWPPLRQALCGDGHPNARRKQLLQRVVFQLARDEVFEADDPTIANRTFRAGNGGPTELVNIFFNFDFRSSVYYGAPNHFQTIYMLIWKGASQQIHDMEIELFSHKQRFKGTYKAKPGALKDALKNVGIIDNTEIEEVPSRVEMKDPPPPLPTPPCIYTAIRDPISHFLSGYNEADFRMLTKNENANSTLDSKRHPHGPYHYAVPYTPTSSINNTNKAAVEHLHNRRKERFEAFVKDLLREEKI